MLFNSLEFLLFFPIVTVIYFSLPLRGRWVWLLVASACFYMAFIPAYVLIILFTIVVDYFAGLWIAGSVGRRRRMWLAASILVNVGFLAFFKYFNFAATNIEAVARLLGSGLTVGRARFVLPIGLSFHTFQAMAYTIEVYRGRQQAERNFVVYALYVMFYPQLVAGPIERPQNILPQLRTLHRYDADRAEAGLRLMLVGFVKKVLVADRISAAVDVVYGHPRGWSGPALCVATVCFAVQIYADFSGYSDIALGSARVMGIDLMTNFREPYMSRSIGEFWSRWHISLSTWFRDYVYIPLGGNRVGPWRHKANIMITFLLSGLWHGANWTYVAWGGLNGAYLLVEGSGARGKKRGAWWVVPTFILTCAAWIFFRANTIGEALFIVLHLPLGWQGPLAEISRQFLATGHSLPWVAMTLAGAGLLLGVDAYASSQRAEPSTLLLRLPVWVRWPAYHALVAGLVIAGAYGRQQFIYFQF
jgi:alginate O-acetyltransferase complex protein AlgI